MKTLTINTNLEEEGIFVSDNDEEGTILFEPQQAGTNSWDPVKTTTLTVEGDPSF